MSNWVSKELQSADNLLVLKTLMEAYKVKRKPFVLWISEKLMIAFGGRVYFSSL